MFKAKFFHQGSFLDVPPRHNPSYVWRSIHASHVVVKSGLKQRIGNDHLVNVWNQPWLKSDNNLHVLTPLLPSNGPKNLKVISLIHHDSSTWRMDLLHQVYNEHDTLAIQTIPLLNFASNDELIWTFSKNEEYFVCKV